MSWAKIVKKHCSSQAITYDGTNSEGFVPNRTREPHLHCGTSFITFTDVGHSHTSIADGNSVRPGASEVLASLADADPGAPDQIRRVLQHLVDNY